MNVTIKAILARFGGNADAAHQYCVKISGTATNPHLQREYQQLAIAIYSQYMMKKREAAHA